MAFETNDSVLFIELFLIQRCPDRERFHCIYTLTHSLSHTHKDPDDCGDYVMGTSPDGVAEECDEGPTGGDCCTDECKLKTGAVCR